MIDDHNRIVYDSDPTLFARELDETAGLSAAVGKQGTIQANWRGVEYAVVYDTSELTGWKMFVYIPMAEITRQATEIRTFTNVSTLMIIAFALFISIVLTYALTRPLRKLKLLMREVQRGKLDVRFNVKYSDEIGSVGTHFNIMLARIGHLIEEVKWTQVRKREAELQSLQHQINPHFIYNTLEMIRMTAEAKDDEEIGDMMFVLGKLLRYGVARSNALVTIGEELEHLKNYLALQNLRFSNRFILVTEIPEGLLTYRCIKLLFQPLVENAIYHAFKHNLGPGTIRITAEDTAEGLYVRVADDGSGMSPDALRELNLRLDRGETEPGGRGIGLCNVNERIRLHDGDNYGLSVESKEGSGTVVTIHLPNFAALSGEIRIGGISMALHLAIVDDEERIRIGLERMLAKCTLDLKIVRSYANGMDAMQGLLGIPEPAASGQGQGISAGPPRFENVRSGQNCRLYGRYLFSQNIQKNDRSNAPGISRRG
nr:histidine kinase [Paenibacillus cymbidii]